MNKKIVLASSSPRRKELLQEAGIDFIVDASSIDEVLDETLPLEKKLEKLAIDKAKPIHEKYPNDIVIGSDTTVYFNNQVIGKPKDQNDAKEILTQLSHHKHTVYTSVAIYFGNELHSFVEHTNVYFKDIMPMLEDYLLSGEWDGKAGAYAIQGKASQFVDHIEGYESTVIGLPVERVVEELNKYQ